MTISGTRFLARLQDRSNPDTLKKCELMEKAKSKADKSMLKLISDARIEAKQNPHLKEPSGFNFTFGHLISEVESKLAAQTNPQNDTVLLTMLLNKAPRFEDLQAKYPTENEENLPEGVLTKAQCKEIKLSDQLATNEFMRERWGVGRKDKIAATEEIFEEVGLLADQVNNTLIEETVHELNRIEAKRASRLAPQIQ